MTATLNAASAAAPLPRHMRNLPVHRGYPVPFIVARLNGDYIFAINDSRRVLRCINEKRCSVCGIRLEPILWWAAGPVAALDPHGAYKDTAMHHDCMTYALRVCPYLVLRNWRNGVATEAAIELAQKANVSTIDTTMIPGRPEVFIAVASRSYRMSDGGPGGLVQIPERPFLAVEYWRLGQKLDDEQGRILAESEFKKRAPWNDALAAAATRALPSHCWDCGTFLMGGATKHKPGCAVQRLIDEAMG